MPIRIQKKSNWKYQRSTTKLYSGLNQVSSYIIRAWSTRSLPDPGRVRVRGVRSLQKSRFQMFHGRGLWPTPLNINVLEPVCFYFEMGVRGKMITCGNKFLLTISNKKEIVYELEFTVIIEDGPRQGSKDLFSV